MIKVNGAIASFICPYDLRARNLRADKGTVPSRSIAAVLETAFPQNSIGSATAAGQTPRDLGDSR